MSLFWLLIPVLFAMVSKTEAVLTFPSASLTCPQITSLCGNKQSIYPTSFLHLQLLILFLKTQVTALLLMR